jgi:PKHD-type hydroxylase
MLNKIVDLPKKKEFKVVNSVWSFNRDHVENWAFWNDAFSKDECKEIIRLGESRILKPARIKEKIDNDVIKEVKEEQQEFGVDKKIRDSKIGWIYPDDAHWIYERLSNAITNLNNDYFKFDLFGLIEGLQFTKYEAPSGHYGAHIDKCFDGIIRKLSISVQLSDPKDYEGGDLEFNFGGSGAEKTPKEQGKLIAFPSYVVHEVRPVTKGTRYSLVAWVTGTPFK